MIPGRLAVKTFCKNCGTKVLVSEVIAGSVVDCSRCGRSFRIGPDPASVGVLRLVQGHDVGDVIYFEKKVTIGRSSGCDIPLPDPIVSRMHAALEFMNGTFYVRDLGSRHGVCVNEWRTVQRPLRTGDRVKIGNTVFEFTCLDPTYSPRDYPCATPQSLSLDVAYEIRLPWPQEPHEPWDVLAAWSPETTRNFLQTLVWVNACFNRPLDSKQFLREGLEVILKALGADLVQILSPDPQGEDLVTKGLVCASGVSGREPMKPSASVVRRCLEEGASFLIEKEKPDKPQKDSSDQVRWALLVPATYVDVEPCVLWGEIGRRSVESARHLLIEATILARALVAALQNRLRLEQIQDATRDRVRLERQFGPQATDEILAEPRSLAPTKSLVPVSVLSMRLHGIEAGSTTVDPRSIVTALDEFYEVASDVISRHKGILQSIDGTVIRAFWGFPTPNGETMLRAIQCALDIRSQIVQLDRLRGKAMEKTIGLGCGIATGPGIVAELGPSYRKDWICLGNVTDLADEIAARADDRILICPATYQALGGLVEIEAIPAEVGPFDHQTLEIHELIGLKTGPFDKEERRRERRLRTAVQAYCILSDGRRLEAIIVDFSPSGAALNIELQVDQIVAVADEIELLCGDRSFHGTVRNVMPSTDGVGYPFYRIGVGFEEVALDLLDSVKRACEIPSS